MNQIRPELSQHLLIFCKVPVAGKVKTRLRIDPQNAAQMHEEMVISTINRCRAPAWATSLHLAGDLRNPFVDLIKPAIPKVPQPDGDLGIRMLHAISAMFGEVVSAKRVVLIGTDCPLIDEDYIRAAFEALNDHDVVLGPAEDGGYGLIGVNAPHPALFANINWGTDSVAAETCRVLNQLRLDYALLPLIWDVDRPEDLKRYQVWKEACSTPIPVQQDC